MTRTFESGPSIPPAGEYGEPPRAIERPQAQTPHEAALAAALPVPPRCIVDEQQITVRRLIEMLRAEVAADPSVADATVWSEGCDCRGEALGIEVEPGMVSISRGRR